MNSFNSKRGINWSESLISALVKSQAAEETGEITDCFFKRKP